MIASRAPSTRRHVVALRVTIFALACSLLATAACREPKGPAVSSEVPVKSGLGTVDSYPVIVVPAEKLPLTRDFYVSQLGLIAVFESTWFVALGHRGDGAIALALMAHDHPSSPPGPETFSGQGMFVTFQVNDVRRALDAVQRAGVDPIYPLTDEVWGQRRFSVRDPAGTMVDVVQQIDPAPGFWEKYSPDHGRSNAR